SRTYTSILAFSDRGNELLLPLLECFHPLQRFFLRELRPLWPLYLQFLSLNSLCHHNPPTRFSRFHFNTFGPDDQGESEGGFRCARPPVQARCPAKTVTRPSAFDTESARV